MITYLHSNGVYEKDGDKQIRADGQDKALHTHTPCALTVQQYSRAQSQTFHIWIDFSF